MWTKNRQMTFSSAHPSSKIAAANVHAKVFALSLSSWQLMNRMGYLMLSERMKSPASAVPDLTASNATLRTRNAFRIFYHQDEWWQRSQFYCPLLILTESLHTGTINMAAFEEEEPGGWRKKLGRGCKRRRRRSLSHSDTNLPCACCIIRERSLHRRHQ